MSLNPVHGEVYSIQHYVIKFVSDLRQVSGFLRVLRFPPLTKLTVTKKWNIVESGIKHHNTNTTHTLISFISKTRLQPAVGGRHLGVSYRVCNMFFNTNLMQFFKYLLLFTYVFVIKQICFPHGKFVTKKDSGEKYFLVNLCT